MKEAIKNWLPVKTCNRVALAIAAVAVLLFVICNFLPYYENSHYHRSYYAAPSRVPEYKGGFHEILWADVFDMDRYIDFFKSPDMEGFKALMSNLGFLFNVLIMLVIVPCWRIFHASPYLRIPIALASFYMAFLAIQISILCQQGSVPVSTSSQFMLVGIAMAAIGAALVIFENELDLRNEKNLKIIMGQNKCQ